MYQPPGRKGFVVDCHDDIVHIEFLWDAPGPVQGPLIAIVICAPLLHTPQVIGEAG
jgi:hypothetical protein